MYSCVEFFSTISFARGKRIQNYSSKRHIRQLRIILFGRFWLMVIVMVGVMVKLSVMVRVSVSVRSIVMVS